MAPQDNAQSSGRKKQQNNMRQIKLLSIAAALTLAICVSGYAQNASGSQQQTTTYAVQPTTVSNTAHSEPQDIDELRKNALLVAENKKLKGENEGLVAERDALVGQRDSALGLVEHWKKIAGEWELASKANRTAATTGVAIDTRLQSDLDKTDAELERTRTLLDQCRNPGFLRSIFKTDTLFKVGAGIAIGRATAPK
jgi:hypothetical protein